MNIDNSIKAIIILQTEGRRVLAKYYDDQLELKSKKFEKSLFANTKPSKVKDEIRVLDGVLIVHKFITDSHIYVVGDRTESALVLESVLDCLVEVISSLPNNRVGNNLVLDNIGRVILALDEICDSGMILETDPNLVDKRITAVSHDDESIGQISFRKLIGI